MADEVAARARGGAVEGPRGDAVEGPRGDAVEGPCGRAVEGMAAAGAAIGMAPPVRPLEAGEPPFAVLVDFDGTVARTDVGDAIVAAHVPGDWRAEEAAWEAGLLGSRHLMEDEVARLPADPVPLVATASAQPLDEGFTRLVEVARACDVTLEVVSDGFGFFIRPALERLGVPDVPVVSARFEFGRDGRPSIAWPNGDPACFVCGTCKRDRVLAHRAAGRAVVFVGDGASDRYAAAYSDVVFAKRSLVRICRENGWPYTEWVELAEVAAWLEATVGEWRRTQAEPSLPAKPFICGAEVWGPGRLDPPSPVAAPGAESFVEGQREAGSDTAAPDESPHA